VRPVTIKVTQAIPETDGKQHSSHHEKGFACRIPFEVKRGIESSDSDVACESRMLVFQLRAFEMA
jgi:hypothetical protein